MCLSYTNHMDSFLEQFYQGFQIFHALCNRKHGSEILLTGFELPLDICKSLNNLCS